MSHICDTNLSSHHHHHHHHHQRAAPVAVVGPLVNAHAWAKPGRARRLTAAQRRHPAPLPRHHTTQPNDAAHRQLRRHVTIQLRPLRRRPFPTTPPCHHPAMPPQRHPYPATSPPTSTRTAATSPPTSTCTAATSLRLPVHQTPPHRPPPSHVTIEG